MIAFVLGPIPGTGITRVHCARTSSAKTEVAGTGYSSEKEITSFGRTESILSFSWQFKHQNEKDLHHPYLPWV